MEHDLFNLIAYFPTKQKKARAIFFSFFFQISLQCLKSVIKPNHKTLSRKCKHQENSWKYFILD